MSSCWEFGNSNKNTGADPLEILGAKRMDGTIRSNTIRGYCGACGFCIASIGNRNRILILILILILISYKVHPNGM